MSLLNKKHQRELKQLIKELTEEAKNVVETLNQTASLFSKLVARQLKTKYSPKLSFFVDFSFSQAEKIDSLINTK